MVGYKPLPEDMRGPKPATESTRRSNKAILDWLDFTDKQSFENAKRGFIASLPKVVIPHDHASRPAYDLEALKFLDAPVPDTVDPSLWRMAQLMMPL